MARITYKDWQSPEKRVLLQGWKRNGLTDQQIAKNIGISRKTLWSWQKRDSNIRNALKMGHDEANFAIESELFKKAMSGNITAMIFWLKNNWRDKYNDSELSKEERELALSRKRKLDAEADIAENNAKELKADGGGGKTIIVDDIKEAVKSEHSTNDERD